MMPLVLFSCIFSPRNSNLKKLKDMKIKLSMSGKSMELALLEPWG